jgi:hydrogenase-4 component E
MTPLEFLSIAAAVFAILMCGTGLLRFNLFLYSLQTFSIALATIAQSQQAKEPELYFVAIAIIVVKALAVPYFLSWISNRIDARSDPGILIPIPITMHAAIVLLGISYPLAKSLPHILWLSDSTVGATVAISLLFTGTLFMLTRRNALSQIIGFLTLENGIYLVAVTCTRGMPFIFEMGSLLDVLVAVMIAGLFVFRIKKSFEHIDVTQLDGLKES